MANPEEERIIWSEYMKYRAKLRGFKLKHIEHILRYSNEKYFDTATRRLVVVGGHDDQLVLIPYEIKGNEIKPVTIHATTRQQINFRVRTGRFLHG